MNKFTYLNPLISMPARERTTSWENSVRACSRCQGCSQSCPSYRMQPQEIFSPRGRVQLIRLFLEGKITHDQQVPFLEKSIRTCLLCARCSDVCAGNVPVAHHMVALSQAHHITLLPWLLRVLLTIRRKWPSLSHFIIRLALALHYIRFSVLCYLLLPGWAKHLYHLIPFKTHTLTVSAQSSTPDLLYLPSFYTQYIEGTLAQQILQLSKAKQPFVLPYMSSGLSYYLYQSRATCLLQAKKLLLLWEKYSADKPLPLLTDSVEEYLFIKNYPFLFQALPAWKKRAEKLAAHVRFITDLSFPKPKHLLEDLAALDASSVLYTAQPLILPAKKILKTFYGKNFVECEYQHFPLPVAAAGLIKNSQASKIVSEYAREIARQHLTHIYCLSGWAALELNAELKKHYSTAKATPLIHIVCAYDTVQK